MSDLVVKSNKLNEAKSDFLVNEYKLVLYFLSKIKGNLFGSIKLSINEFNKSLGIESEATYSQLKKYCKKLISKTIIIEDEDNNQFKYINWFESIESKDGYVDMTPTKKLRRFVDVSKNFLSYDINNVMKLKSYYSIRIYELTKQYEKIGKREIKVVDLRYMLGIKETQYKRFSNFRKKVLNVAENEINLKTDIKIVVKEEKCGRRVNKIKFFIYSNKNSNNNIFIEKFKVATGQILNCSRLDELISKKGIETVEFYINNFYKFMQYTNVKDPVRLFYAAVINEYSLPKEHHRFNKPEQSLNFDQREYDDEFYESLYENSKYIGKED